MSILSNKTVLFSIAAIEGACVMAAELVGAKMIAPFFGSSLYVWAAVLGVTLFALMIGYYLGGYISTKTKQKAVLWVLISAGAFLMIMPYSSYWVMSNTLDMEIRVGATISLLFFLMPPLILMGMTSPMIINLINTNVDTSGKIAGKVYAISTFGGIIGTFLTGFYLLPEFGVKWPCFFFGVLISILPIILLVKKNPFKITSLFILILYVSYSNDSSGLIESHKSIHLVYHSEGILGQVRVYDMPFLTIHRGMKKGRLLMVNNTAQTILDKEDPTRDLWDHSYFFPIAASVYKPKSDVLLMGLGGGALVHHFNRLNFDMEIVELDERLKDVAINYFNVDPKIPIHIDDARRYLNNCEKKFDIIVMDLFLNETPPSHVLTKESFNQAKKCMKKNGMLMINFFGFIKGEEGRAARSILKTLNHCGFNVEILPTPGEEGHRNLIFLAGESLPDFSSANYQLADLPVIENVPSYFIDQKQLDLSQDKILTDKIPALEKMYLQPALLWRSFAIKYNIKRLIKNDYLLVL